MRPQNTDTPPPRQPEIDDLELAAKIGRINSAAAVLAHDFGPPEPRGLRGEWCVGWPRSAG